MKNNILFMLLAGSLALISCGTANRASYSSQNFTNGIYYTPDDNETQRIAQAKRDFKELKEETGKALSSTTESTFDPKTGVETIYIGDTNSVTIDYNPYKTYLLTDDMESYAARAEKYNSPLYTINIDMGVSLYDGWYRPYWSRYGYGWHNPYWGPHYSWWGPSYYYGYGWYDPWYYGYGWYDPWYSGYYGWYDPWWGPGYYPGYYPGYPGYYPGLYPPHHPHGPARDIYYGKRENGNGGQPGSRGGGSYARREASMSQIRGNGGNMATNATAPSGSSSARNEGSIYRRGAGRSQNGALYNNTAANTGRNPNQSANVRPENSRPTSSSGTMYRRSANQSTTKSSATTTKREYNNSQQNSYGRSSNPAYNRSGNSSTYNPSYNSSGSHRSTGTSSGGGRSGSSYRR